MTGGVTHRWSGLTFDAVARGPVVPYSMTHSHRAGSTDLGRGPAQLSVGAPTCSLG
jgi:hypothetical protein